MSNDKNEKIIMIVDKERLLGEDYFNGFSKHDLVDYERRILKNFKYMKRGLAEQDYTKKQPIAYAVIANKKNKKVFAYQRASSTKAHGDERLQNKWSWGVGGHIEKIDRNSDNPIVHSMLREISEEIQINGDVKTKVLGYINDDSNDVGKVHFGILYLVETDEDVKPKSEELRTGKMVDLKEMEKICSSSTFNVEDWSKIAFEPLKEHL